MVCVSFDPTTYLHVTISLTLTSLIALDNLNILDASLGPDPTTPPHAQSAHSSAPPHHVRIPSGAGLNYIIG